STESATSHASGRSFANTSSERAKVSGEYLNNSSNTTRPMSTSTAAPSSARNGPGTESGASDSLGSRPRVARLAFRAYLLPPASPSPRGFATGPDRAAIMGRHDAAAGAGNDSGGEKETRDPLPRAVQRVRGPRAREASRAARRGPGPGSARDRRPDHALGRVPRVQRARDRRARVVPARRLARITWRRWHFPCLGARVAAELRSEGRSMEGAKPDQVSVAESFLRALKRRGIDYVFANAGTDFAPIIEALVKLRHDAGSLPRFITVPHENLAVAMAHGYYLVTGKPAGVMVHVTVGTANTVCALMNAYR